MGISHIFITCATVMRSQCIVSGLAYGLMPITKTRPVRTMTYHSNEYISTDFTGHLIPRGSVS